MLVITGGTGMLGQYLLAQVPNRLVRVVMQPGDARRCLVENQGFEVVEADITEPRAIQKALRGARQVVHLAGFVNGARGIEADFMRINAEGTANVALAAKAADVELVAFASSITVYGPVRGAWESWPLLGTSGYARSKREAECYLQSILPSRSVIVRFPGLFGVGDTGTMLPLIENFKRLRHVIVIGRGKEDWSVLAAEDAARALLMALDCPETWGQAWNVGGGVTTNGELFALIGRFAGLRSVAKLPYALAMGLAAFDELCGRAYLTRDQVRTLAKPLSMSDQRFREVTGFEPQIDWQLALRLAVEWAMDYLEQGGAGLPSSEGWQLREDMSVSL